MLTRDASFVMFIGDRVKPLSLSSPLSLSLSFAGALARFSSGKYVLVHYLHLINGYASACLQSAGKV